MIFILVVDPNIPVVCEPEQVLRSIHSSDELIGVHYVDRQHALTRWALWIEEVSQDSASMGQADLRIKALIKGNIKLCKLSLNISLRSRSYPSKSHFKRFFEIHI